MTRHEQMMCELQGELFEISLDKFKCGSAFFVARFMSSELAKDLDEVDDPYNFISPNNMVTILKMDYPSLNKERGKKYPRQVLRWIGEVYRAYSIIKLTRSSKLYSFMNCERLLSLYDSFHTFSLEQCVERIDEIIKEENPVPNDMDIFREVMSS